MIEKKKNKSSHKKKEELGVLVLVVFVGQVVVVVEQVGAVERVVLGLQLVIDKSTTWQKKLELVLKWNFFVCKGLEVLISSPLSSFSSQRWASF